MDEVRTGARHMAIAPAPSPQAQPPRLVGEDALDVDLVAAVRAGDDHAFEKLYERYYRRIAAYIYGMVSDYGRAEDIAQDVFMSALRRMRQTDRPLAFKPWIYEIAKNACIDQFRRSRRTQEVSYDADEGLGAADYGRLVTTAPSPEAAAATKQSIEDLQGAFGGLSETHHQILVMRELEGLSYREIGERLGMSRPSVESTLFRARRRLGEEYAELVSGERCLRVQDIIVHAVQGQLGARDRSRLARHVSHCQPCRRHAIAAGVDAEVLAHRPIRAKVAALLPLPAFLRRRIGGDDVGSLAGNPTLAQFSAHLGSTIDPAVASWAKAAAAAASIAVAGVGAGVVSSPPSQRSLRPSVLQRDVTGPSSSAPARAARSGATPGGPSVRSVGRAVSSASVVASPVATPVRRSAFGKSTATANGTAPQATANGGGSPTASASPPAASRTPAAATKPADDAGGATPLTGLLGGATKAPSQTPSGSDAPAATLPPVTVPGVPADPVEAAGKAGGVTDGVKGLVGGG